VLAGCSSRQQATGIMASIASKGLCPQPRGILSACRVSPPHRPSVPHSLRFPNPPYHIRRHAADKSSGRPAAKDQTHVVAHAVVEVINSFISAHATTWSSTHHRLIIPPDAKAQLT
jgi:hypothetical protein